VGMGGRAQLFVNDKCVGRGRIDNTIPYMFSMSGETFDVGEDTGSAVGPYENGFPFTGTIKSVHIELRKAPGNALRETMHRGHLEEALRSL